VFYMDRSSSEQFDKHPQTVESCNGHRHFPVLDMATDKLVPSVHSKLTDITSPLAELRVFNLLEFNAVEL